MGWNDHIDDSEIGNLPEEAFDNPYNLDGPFEPSNRWLPTAERYLQEIALREWFLARFCDPAAGTPYNGREGGYLFIHGGPYDPAEEIPERFTGLVPDDVIEAIVDEMQEQHGDQWAPANNERPDDYDEWLDFQHLVERSEPLKNLKMRIAQHKQLLALQQHPEAKNLCHLLVFSAAVGALEAFLWETVYYWIDNDRKALHDVITQIPVLRDQNIKLGDIVKESKTPKDHVKAYLRGIVWHQLDKVAPLFEKGLGIQLPSLKFFKSALDKRHHIVHRSGHDLEKNPVEVEPQELEALLNNIQGCATAIDQALAARPVK